MATGRTVVVTGAGSGIGRATARGFLDAGWHVALLGRREATLLEAAAGHAQALVLPCDVTDADALDAAFDEAMTDWGRIDCLFNNAGLSAVPAPIDEIPLADLHAVLSVNVTGMVLAARAAFARMRRQNPQGGRIINNGSISAQVPRPGSVPYTVSKHAVTGLTRTLALDGRAFGIACGQIDIGNAETEMVARMKAGIAQADGSVRTEPVMDLRHVVETVVNIASLPLGVNVLFTTIMATDMPFVGRG